MILRVLRFSLVELVIGVEEGSSTLSSHAVMLGLCTVGRGGLENGIMSGTPWVEWVSSSEKLKGEQLREENSVGYETFSALEIALFTGCKGVVEPLLIGSRRLIVLS